MIEELSNTTTIMELTHDNPVNAMIKSFVFPKGTMKANVFRIGDTTKLSLKFRKTMTIEYSPISKFYIDVEDETIFDCFGNEPTPQDVIPFIHRSINSFAILLNQEMAKNRLFPDLTNQKPKELDGNLILAMIAVDMQKIFPLH